MEIAIGVAAAIVLGIVGFAVGRSGARAAGLAEGRGESEARLRAVAESLARGKRPDKAAAGVEGELFAALERGWAPREAERQSALREAVGRVSSFLASSVREPLKGADENSSRAELKERIDRALGALQDVDFFMAEPTGERVGRDLDSLVQQVAREFATDHGVGLRFRSEGASVRATVNPTALMDALYLVLHNAARFGGGATVDVTVTSSGGRSRIAVRDRGEGFSEEAFKRAFDPFYSTSAEGLGLGLPHARKVIESMGGKIELRNVPDGGAEVELSFSSA